MSQMRLTVAQGRPQWVRWENASCVSQWQQDGFYAGGERWASAGGTVTTETDVSGGSYVIPEVLNTDQIIWVWGKILILSDAEVDTEVRLDIGYSPSFYCGARVIEGGIIEVFMRGYGAVWANAEMEIWPKGYTADPAYTAYNTHYYAGAEPDSIDEEVVVGTVSMAGGHDTLVSMNAYAIGGFIQFRICVDGGNIKPVDWICSYEPSPPAVPPGTTPTATLSCTAGVFSTIESGILPGGPTGPTGPSGPPGGPP